MSDLKNNTRIVRYGQVVVGGPGSGKTTYCDGMQQYLKAIGRPCMVVNLDPANEIPHASGEKESNTTLPYDAILDVCEEVIHLSSVMESLDLGPNGGLMYCMEYLERHKDQVIDLLLGRLQTKEAEENLPMPYYILFDFPGQVELYTHSNCVQNLCSFLTNVGNFRLSAIQLTDSLHCLDASKFISSVLLSATSMLRLELPTVNVLSKVDLMGQYTEQHSLLFAFDFFKNVLDLTQLLDFLDASPAREENDDEDYFADDEEYQQARQRKLAHSPFFRKYHKLHKELCEVIEDFNLVSYLPLNIQDGESVGRVLAQADKCNGCAFVPPKNAPNQFMYEATPERLFQSAVQNDVEWGFEQMAMIHERYIKNDVQFRDQTNFSSKFLKESEKLYQEEKIKSVTDEAKE